jgi:hypothetical protein
MSSESAHDQLLSDLLRDNESLAADFERAALPEHELKPQSHSQGPGDPSQLVTRGRKVSKTESGKMTQLITRAKRIDLARDFQNAPENQRRQMLENQATRLALRAIVRAAYRPAYQFGSDYLIRQSLREFKVDAQTGVLWPKFLADTLKAEGWPVWVVGPAKATCRLSLDQTPSGSAFRCGTKSLVTARHVIEKRDKAPIFSEFGVLAADSTTFRVGPITEEFPGCASTIESLPDLAILEYSQADLTNEHVNSSGLTRSTENFSPDDLKGCYVAVIGHPSAEIRYNSLEDFDLVFAGGNPWEKRFMPGRVSSSQSDADGLLVHDCSTLGGASGSPVVYLASADRKVGSLTGKVIGVHVGGSPTMENRAIPIPKIEKILHENGL